MGKRVRVWIMRVIAIVIVVFMVVELGANIFTGNSSSNQKTTEKTTTKTSKYTYVNESSVFHLDGIDQDVLLPKGMTVQSKNEDQNTHAITYNFGAVKYDNFSASILITTKESGKNGTFADGELVSMDTLANGLKENGEYSNWNYLIFRGDTNNYLEQVQTIHQEKDATAKYEIDYNIYDVDGKNYYMISLFLVTPENPDKTDLLHLDKMGKEMMAKMSYMKKDIFMEYALPEDKADQFNHLK
ncbi:MAG: hypothetical protein SOS22_06555 [Absicoccus sp.]|uniref:hypothetical protein n=1 Tax=Absicoccus sp. TaxID=2718527 RepID=UPI002A7581EF|nr:hypothetical protein [Absicoccus sp.]MDY3035864.1 hypothetical protein [Absicoccus sp.]